MSTLQAVTVNGAKVLLMTGNELAKECCCGCPNAIELTVVSSGIVLDCGCFESSSGTFLEVSGEGAVNNTFTVTEITEGTWEGTGGTVHFDRYDACGGTLEESDDQTVKVVVTCVDGEFEVTIYANAPGLGTPSVSFFFGTGTLPVSNVLVCDFQSGGNSGTATVSW